MKRSIALAVAGFAAILMLFAQPVKADPGDNSSLGGWTTATVNQLLQGVPSPSGWQGRHVCFGVDQINWGMCITFPFPT